VQLFLAFVLALSVTAALIPLLERWAPAIGLTDVPGPRKVHTAAVPRVGGLAMAAGVLAATALTVQFTPPVRGLLLGLAVLLAFGLWDDRATLGYRTKFAGQIIAVALCMAVGRVHVGMVVVGGIEVPAAVSMLLTFVFLLGITNAVNLADGLDGLAGGMVLLCLCAIALFAAINGQRSITILTLIEAGAVLGFLRFNTHPARIFMGDSGSQMLGLSVGALALLATQGESSALSAALPLLLLGLPILDTLTVMLTRLRARRSPFSADRNHLHHRLLALGFTHREAVILLYLAQVGLVLLAYFMRFESDWEVVAAFGVFAASVLGLLRWAARSGWRLGQMEHATAVRRCISAIAPAAWLTGATAALMALGVIVYATTVLAARAHVGRDLGIMCLGMLALLLLLGSWRPERALQWFERAAIYVSVVLLVYLDQTIPYKPQLLTTLWWTCIGITGIAALVRYWTSPAHRFELTTLYLIVVFIALVLPNLPGSVQSQLPAVLPGGIAKAVILLYVVEMLFTIHLKPMIPRLILVLTLTTIAARAFLGIGT